MNVKYETERLLLAIGNETMAGEVRNYLVKNREDFARWDRRLNDGYFTPEYIRKSLQAEQRLFMRSEAARFYIFLKTDTSRIIGNVSFTSLNIDNNGCGVLGYKLDCDNRKMGYAYEAVSCLIPKVFDEYRLLRLHADILPENRSSISLITKLGFKYLCISRNAHEINGRVRDHLRYILNRDTPEFEALRSSQSF